MAKVGRPTNYTEEIATAICARYASGETLTRICEDEAMPGLSTVFEWRNRIDAFRELLAKAQEHHADAIVQQLQDVAETEVDPVRARNRIQAKQWVAAKFNREKYGERVDVNHTKNVNITLALGEASERLRSVCDQSQIIEGELIDITGQKVLQPSDGQSDDDDIFS